MTIELVEPMRLENQAHFLMPYSIDKSNDLPANVQKMPMAKKKKWIAIWNSSHASCVKDGGESKECETMAFKMANGVLKKDRDEQGETSMDWLTRIFNKLLGLDTKGRAMSVDNIMQKVYDSLYAMEEMEDENGMMGGEKKHYSIVRLMFDESGLWVVLNGRGSLYRAVINVTDVGDVTLGALQEVKEEYTPVSRNRVWLKRQVDGLPRIYVVAATSILNRVNEIDSRKLFDNMVQHSEEADFFPAIDIHHMGPWNSDLFDIGYIDYIARFGVTYVASGVLDETKDLGHRMARVLESDKGHEWGCSIEYFALGMEQIDLKIGDNGTIPIDVYTDGVNTRISLLPEQRAANWFTKATLKERSMPKPTKDALLTLRKLFESELEFEEFVSQLADVNDEVEQRGLIHRETEEVVVEAKSEQLDPEGSATEPVKEKELAPVERELVVDDDLVGLIAEQVLRNIAAIEPTAEEVARTQQTDDKLNQILASVNGLIKRLDMQDGRLGKLERSREEEEREWISDLPPRLKERVTVTHRPTQANGNGEQIRSADEIAASTLSKIPSLIS